MLAAHPPAGGNRCDSRLCRLAGFPNARARSARLRQCAAGKAWRSGTQRTRRRHAGACGRDAFGTVPRGCAGLARGGRVLRDDGRYGLPAARAGARHGALFAICAGPVAAASVGDRCEVELLAGEVQGDDRAADLTGALDKTKGRLREEPPFLDVPFR
ncbi:hypothetical protein BCAR13_1040050 [Paraburkholderia caribensis]|nr:hypothetical protein BCAR13_1040050 [Paraburkholderia caribensis]